MGFWEKIKKRVKTGVGKVKETYKKVDVALGDALPGRSAPTATEKAIERQKREPTEPTPTPVKREPRLGEDIIPGVTRGEERGVAGMEFDPHREAEAKKMLEAGFTQEDIDAGMTFASAGMASPVTPEDIMAITGIPSVTKAAATAIIRKVSTSLVKNGIASSTKIASEAANLGISPKALTKMMDKKALNMAINDLAKIKTKKVFTGPVAKTFKKTAVLLMGYSGLATWLASDNAAGMASFQTNKIQGRFDNGQITREDALEQMDTQITIIEGSKHFVNVNTMVNPGLWAFRKMFMSTVDNNLVIAEENKKMIQESEETTSAMYERLREEDEERDEAYAEKQEARDEAYASGKKKSDKESDAEFVERTLLFEAIRKRNKGTVLTPEELAVLIKYGLDTKITQSQYEGPSQLGFGLF